MRISYYIFYTHCILHMTYTLHITDYIYISLPVAKQGVAGAAMRESERERESHERETAGAAMRERE